MQYRTIGEVSRDSGLTVRTLRHYDEIGLLTPSARSDAGYRLYSDDDIARLQQVRSLQSMGLSLAAIGSVLDRGLAVRDSLEQLLSATDEQIRRQSALRSRIAGVIALLDQHDAATSGAMLQLIEELAKVEKHYTKEQLDTLAERAADLGDAGMRAAETQWTDLIDRVRTARESGIDPASPQVRAMATEWQSLIDAFTGGDPGIRASLGQVWQQNDDVAGFNAAEIRDLAGYLHSADS
ncbi:MAG: MerR family transcriptional regulator [Thermomicrobiales bacterium]|nr:MerR family transcriptional regulator [Thermomicrobiales bacterium]